MSKLGIDDIYDQIARWNTQSNAIHDLSSLGIAWRYDTCNAGISALSDIALKPSCDGDVQQIEEIVGVGTYFKPEGFSFCDLLSTNVRFRNDLFLVSQLDGSKQLNSYNASYHQLSGRLGLDILCGLGLHTMAFEYRSKYAISSHNHNELYSKVELTVNPKYWFKASQTTNDYGLTRSDISTLGSMSISTDYINGDAATVYADVNKNPSQARTSVVKYDLNMAAIKIPIPPKPLIGTLKFVGISSVQHLVDTNQLVLNSTGINVNPYDSSNKIRDDYDGWVFPNGSTIANINKQLSDASMVFVGDASLNATIPLPNITEFLKANPSTRNDDDGDSIYSTTGSSGMPSHIHAIDPIQIQCDIELDSDNTKIRSTEHNSGAINVHHGVTPDPHDHEKWSDPLSMNVQFDQITFDPPLSTTYTGTTGESYYPAHNIIPIMIYIGGETEKYYMDLYEKYNS